MSFLRIASVGVLVLGGCMGLEQDDELADVELGEVEQQAAGSCPKWMCGTNSPVINTYDFHELAEKLGIQNAERFTISGLKKGGIWYPRIDVDRGKIHFKNSAGLVLLSGVGLVGAEIRLKHTDPAGTTTDWAIKIQGVGSSAYYADNGVVPKPHVETYRMDVSKVVGGVPLNEWRNVCSNPSQDRNETLGLPGDLVVVFEGDRIDGDLKRVDKIDVNWFNLGCAGHALAKMAMAGHTHAAQSDGYHTTVDQRTTFLKMVSADYCGKGFPFTVAGQPLEWKDSNGWMKYDPFIPLGIEARWSPKGATCLTTPRVDANGTVASGLVFGGSVLDEISAHCPALLATPCGGSVEALFGHHLVTANP